jgi:hypothetical protein
VSNYPDFPQSPALQFVPFHEAHLMSLRIGNEYSQSISKVLPINQMVAAQARHGDAFTAILHGMPVACFGSVRIWNGVEEMWLLMEERGRQVALSLTKAAIAYRDFRVISGNLHRLQITVRCEDMRAVKWGLRIGFSIDGMMKSYGPDGSDYYLMSRS